MLSVRTNTILAQRRLEKFLKLTGGCAPETSTLPPVTVSQIFKVGAGFYLVMLGWSYFCGYGLDNVASSTLDLLSCVLPCGMSIVGFNFPTNIF